MGSQSASSARIARSFSAPRAAERGPAAASASAWSRPVASRTGASACRPRRSRRELSSPSAALELAPLVGARAAEAR